MKNETLYVLVAVGMLLVGILLGWTMAVRAWTADCDRIGYRTEGGMLYRCEVVKGRP